MEPPDNEDDEKQKQEQEEEEQFKPEQTLILRCLMEKLIKCTQHRNL
jgi:hypothetical protein